MSRLLHIVLAEINLDEQCMAECEQQLKRWHADDDIVRKLDEVSGIGLLTASALTAVVGSLSALPMVGSSEMSFRVDVAIKHCATYGIAGGDHLILQLAPGSAIWNKS